MAKTKKTIVKAPGKKSAPGAAEAPPPAAAKASRGAPAGGKLVWVVHGSDTWLASDPDSDAKKAGARIKMLTQGWLGKPNDPVYLVYRDAEYLGSDPTLEAAQRRAQYREKSAGVLTDKVSGDLPAFLALTAEERRKLRAAAPMPQASPARAGKSSGVLAAEAEAAARRAPAESPEAAAAAAVRASLRPAKSPRASAKAAKEAVSQTGAVLRLRVKENPRKAGTGKHARFAIVMQHDGKTAKEFADAGGNMETLANAVKEGLVELDSSKE